MAADERGQAEGVGGGVVRVGVGVEEEGGRADARIVMDMSQTAGFSVPA